MHYGAEMRSSKDVLRAQAGGIVSVIVDEVGENLPRRPAGARDEATGKQCLVQRPRR